MRLLEQIKYLHGVSDICFMKSFSLDLRNRIVEACEAGGESQRAIGSRFDVSYSFVLKLWFQWRHTGSLEPLKRSGRRPAFDARALQRLKKAVKDHPDATLEELREACSVDCSFVTVHNTLKREGFRRKKNATR